MLVRIANAQLAEHYSRAEKSRKVLMMKAAKLGWAGAGAGAGAGKKQGWTKSRVRKGKGEGEG